MTEKVKAKINKRVEKYVELLRNKDNYYEMKYDIRRGTIQSEEYKNGKIIFSDRIS